MPLQSGRLDRRITLQTKNITQSDSGEEVVTWDDIGTVWAQKIEMDGVERFSVKQIVGHAVKTFRVRWSTVTSQLTVEDRILFDGRIFDITDVREIERRVGVEIDAFTSGELPLAPESGGEEAASFDDDDIYFDNTNVTFDQT